MYKKWSCFLFLILIFATQVKAAPSFEEVIYSEGGKSYTDFGSGVIHRDDGINFTKQGNTIYASDGTTYTQYGNMMYGTNGKNYSMFGDFIYSSDGTTYSKYGYMLQGSDGTNCTQFGNRTSCQ